MEDSPKTRARNFACFVGRACGAPVAEKGLSPYAGPYMTQQAKLIFAIVASTVCIFGGLAYVLVRSPGETIVVNANAVFHDDKAISIGKTDASVVVHAYSDFQCPACKSAEPAFKAIVEAYKDRVKFIWKDFPLLTIHPNARAAANAAQCANAQGKFWDYHDRLYAAQEVWSGLTDPKERFVQLANDSGLDAGEFAACYDARRHDALVMKDEDEGLANGVDSTPTFYIGNAVARVRTEAQWRAALDAALERAQNVSSTVTTSTK